MKDYYPIIPIGTLVELKNGARLFVVGYEYDFNDKLHYSLCFNTTPYNGFDWIKSFPADTVRAV